MIAGNPNDVISCEVKWVAGGPICTILYGHWSHVGQPNSTILNRFILIWLGEGKL